MNNNDKWLRYCDLLFSDDSLGFWLDISRMDVEKSDFEKFKVIFHKAFDSVESLENGSIANITSSRVAKDRVRKIKMFQQDLYVTIDFLAGISEVY